MGKTLVIAEKPSVGRDLTKALSGAFQKHEGYLESETHVITWAVGHLVQLAEPDEYDAKYKKWRMADLPIVPDHFKLVVRDERSRKQMSVISRMLKRDDVSEVINACDAGREGELIFAWTFEKAGAKKPVRRLWLSSMTSAAIKQAFSALRPAQEFALLGAGRPVALGGGLDRRHERDPRGDDPPALLVRRRRVPGARADADAGDHRPPRGRDPRVRARSPTGSWTRRSRPSTIRASTSGATMRARSRGWRRPRRPRRSSRRSAAGSGTITKLEKTKRSEKAPLLYDLTSLQREANTRFGFSARRTLSAAQRLYEEHKLLTYPRTNSRFLPSDMVGEIKPIVSHVAVHREYAKAAAYVNGLDVLPLGRVINDAKVTDHHAIIPTNSDQKIDKLSDDDRRVYDMVVRRFLAVFHPDAVFENTRLETTVAEHIFRTRGRVLLEAGWRGVYGEIEEGSADGDDEGADQTAAEADQGESVSVLDVASDEKITQPPRRYSDASLLGAMETAGKLVEDEELREAMKDSGIGTPATRAAIIERLIDVGYVERDGRSLVCTEKGLGVIRLLDDHALTSPSLTGDWEHRLTKIEEGDEERAKFMADIAAFAGATVTTLDEKLKEVRIPRANLGPCPVCGHDIVENRKGFSCWAPRGPGLRLRDLEEQGRQDAPAGGRPRADLQGPHREGGHRVQGPLRPLLPREARPDADRRGPLARRVRRALGPRGRQAARGRGPRARRRGGCRIRTDTCGLSNKHV